MSAAVQQRMSLDEFLAWERGQELRWEFDGFAPVAMNGGTVGHSQIATNIVEALGRRLRGSPCRVFRGDIKVIVNGRVRYPDAVVTCTPVAATSDIVPEPVVVFEVLSPSTAGVDRVRKNFEYSATPSIRHYVMLEQSAMAATIFSRDGSDWVGHLRHGDVDLALPALGLTLPLREAYEGVELPDEPTD